MKTATITISKSIPLPTELRSDWQNQRAYIEAQGDTIIVKRIEPSSWDDILPKLRRAGKRISPATIRKTIALARKEA